jgi:transposase
MARPGGRWRDWPARLGNYHSVKRRYDRWIAMGVLEAMFEAVAREADMELAKDRFNHRAGASASGWHAESKKGRMCRALAAPAAV